MSFSKLWSFGSLIDVLMILSYLQNETFPDIETYLHCEIDPWVEKDKTNHWNEAWICNSCWEVAHLISNIIPRVYIYKCASICDTRWSSATLYIIYKNSHIEIRGEICRHCQRQCKILASRVNFSRNNAIYNINESTKYILPWFHL